MDNRRKTIVINKKFQYQYSLLIVALTILLVNGYLIFRALFPGQAPLALDTGTALVVAAVDALLLGAIWYGSLKASHRIAGPVYVFAREIGKLGRGDLTGRIRLRDKDMFKPEAQTMNASLVALGGRIEAIKEQFTELQKLKAEGADISPALKKLEEQLAVLSTGTEG